MKSGSKPTTVAQYIADIAEPKRADIAKLHALIQKTLPSFEPAVGSGMLGYGKFHYRYESGREGDTFRIALASNKTGISIYVNAVDEGGWVAEQAKDRLGRASVGKSCIRFKKLSDIDLRALIDVLRHARKVPGAGEVAGPKNPGKKAAK